MDKLAERVALRFAEEQQAAEPCLGGEGCSGAQEEHLAVAPEGWEGPIKDMKKDKDIDNPFALAWWMKDKGYEPHKE